MRAKREVKRNMEVRIIFWFLNYARGKTAVLEYCSILSNQRHIWVVLNETIAGDSSGETKKSKCLEFFQEEKLTFAVRLSD